jgi:hypothetical protein
VGLRPGLVKGGTTRDIPVPESVIAYLLTYTKEVLPNIAGTVTPETPLFWSKWVAGSSAGRCSR